MTWIYDCEVVINAFTVCFLDINNDKELIEAYKAADISKNITAKQKVLAKLRHKIFIIHEETNNIGLLVEFLNKKSTATLVGYNSFKYDDILIDYILQNASLLRTYSVDRLVNTLYGISQEIISYQQIGTYRKDFGIKYSYKYISIDLMRLHGLDKSYISLKQVSIRLKWYRVEDYTPPLVTQAEIDMYYVNVDVSKVQWFERYVLHEHLQGLLDYNINDVLITYELYYYGLDELKNRIATQLKYKVNVLSSSRSNMADRLMSKSYEDATGLSYWDFRDKRTYRRKIKFNDLIVPEIEFRTNELQLFLTELKKKVINVGTDKFKEVLIFKGTGYTFAKGGLHSKDRGAVFVSDDKSYVYKDVDVNSYYPSGIINMKIKPKHLLDIIIDVIEHYRKSRIKAKLEGNKTDADIFKIVLNAFYGKMGFEYSWMFDILAMYKVTVNLQLLLMILIEDLELANFHVVSANTDGIITKIPVDKVHEYKKICQTWANKFNFGIGYTDFDKYVRTTVNDYIAFLSDGSVKLKGDFNYKLRVEKGYFAPIIARTLYEYYKVDNLDINEYIKGHDIMDYCISFKIGNQFITELHSIKDSKKDVEVLQKDNRFFISNTGGVILKHHLENHTYHNIIKGQYVTVFNRFYNSNNYNIKYSYYASKVRDLINKINNANTKDMKKVAGQLFDNIS